MKATAMETGSQFQRNLSFGILLLRIFVGLRLLYGVVDNIISWEKMLEFSMFLEGFGFPLPTISAILSVYAQFFAAVFISIGYKTRFFSWLMVFNFVVALLFVHFPARDSIEVMTPALAMLFICLAFTFTGAAKFSLDHLFAKSGGKPAQLEEKFKKEFSGQKVKIK